MQDKAFVVALNFAVLLCSARVCIAYGGWWWRARKELAYTTMGLLPVSVFWLSLAVGLEAAYYGSARVLAHYSDVNLWDEKVPVNAIRLMLIGGAFIHMVPYWKALRSDCVTCWLGFDAAIYVFGFVGLAWWLY